MNSRETAMAKTPKVNKPVKKLIAGKKATKAAESLDLLVHSTAESLAGKRGNPHIARARPNS